MAMKINLIRGAVLLVVAFAMISQAKSEIFKTSDGVTIDYEVKGSGQPLVMLHSGMMSREDMRTQIDHFSRSYKVIALDSREQGRSSSSQEQISYDLMARDVVDLLDHLNIEKANMFGQSDGGVTALVAAHKYPQRLLNLIIHGAVYSYTAYPAEQRRGWKNISFDQKNNEETNPEGFPGMAISHYLMGRKDISAFGAHLQEMSYMWATSPNLTKGDLGKIKVPTLVIVGDHWDISIPHTLEMHEALANSELFVAPGATHYIHREKPDLLHKVMEDFLHK